LGDRQRRYTLWKTEGEGGGFLVQGPQAGEKEVKAGDGSRKEFLADFRT